jgi:hypothetical protein
MAWKTLNNNNKITCYATSCGWRTGNVSNLKEVFQSSRQYQSINAQ